MNYCTQKAGSHSMQGSTILVSEVRIPVQENECQRLNEMIATLKRKRENTRKSASEWI
jgi:hypothetical protein